MPLDFWATNIPMEKTFLDNYIDNSNYMYQVRNFIKASYDFSTPFSSLLPQDIECSLWPRLFYINNVFCRSPRYSLEFSFWVINTYFEVLKPQLCGANIVGYEAISQISVSVKGKILLQICRTLTENWIYGFLTDFKFEFASYNNS